MDNFTVGDRCLVHLLESEAGQPLNGLHVTLVKAIIQNGRFKCRFDDGTVKQIKPCNLQIINGHRANQTKEKCEENASSNLNKTEDQTKMEVTTDDDKKEISATTTIHQQQQQQRKQQRKQQQREEEKEEREECSICLDLLPTDASEFLRATCCGKGMHKKCREDMIKSKMSQDQKRRCVMCRTKYPDDTKEGDKEIVEQLRKWVKKGKAWAQSMLGARYRDGTHGVKKDIKRAAVLFNLASEQGDVVAQYNLGCLYDIGHGVDKDKKRAVELFTLAADQGYVNAQFNLGNIYRYGRGVDKDEKRAVEMYTLAADQGDGQAQFNLGCMFAEGKGVDQSLGKTREWLTKAALQGNEDAINGLKQLDEAEGRTTTPSSTSSTVNSTTTFCSYCNKPEPTHTKFNRCKGCRSVAYCNRECQIKHWKTKTNGHKKQCKKLKALKALQQKDKQ